MTILVQKNKNNLSFDTVADMALANIEAGEFVNTQGRYVDGDEGAAKYFIKTLVAFGGTPDELSEITLANTNVAVLHTSGEINAKQFGLKGDGVDESANINKLETKIFNEKLNAYFPDGTYDNGINNWPFRNQVNPTAALRDYGGITVRGNGDNTIFRTTSIIGADVLQLNAVKNITFRDLMLKATISGAVDGSNGVSITNGGENIYIYDVAAEDLPGLDETSFIDGSKAFSIQPADPQNNPLRNIKIRGRAKNCAFAFNFDSGYNAFDAQVSGVIPYAGVDIDVVAEDCWRAVTLGGAAATATLSDDDKDSDVKIKVTAINCSQSVISSRWVRAKIDAHIITTKSIANLYKPLAADQTVYAAFIDADYGSQINIKGRMEECDSKLKIGAAGQAFSVYGGSDKTQLNFEIDCPTVTNDEILVISQSGNTTRNCHIKLASVTDGTGTDLINDSNRVVFGPDYVYSNMSVKRTGVAWDVFKVDTEFDGIQIARTGSGPGAGTTAGFAVVKDTVTGTDYKIQLYT
jgi:hypothetical protein